MESQNKPSVSVALSWAFDTFKRNAVPFIALAAVVAVIQMAQQLSIKPLENIITDCVDPQSPGQIAACNTSTGSGAFAALGLTFIFMLLAAFATIGVYRAALRTTQGGEPSFQDMLTTQYLGRYIAFTIVLILLSLAGLVLCIIPMFLVIFFLQLGPYYVLDKGYGAGTAIKASFKAIKTYLGPAVLLTLMNIAVSLVGSMLFGILTLVTLPFVALFTAHMYRQFNQEAIV